MGFFDNTRVDVEDLVCALGNASGTPEYPREHARAHSVGTGLIIVGFDVGSKGSLQPRTISRGNIFPIPQWPLGGYSASAREKQSK
jgi:hypothetical protein